MERDRDVDGYANVVDFAVGWIVDIAEYVDDVAGKLRIHDLLGEVAALVTEATHRVEADIHQWVQTNGVIPPGHGSAVVETEPGVWIKAAWKGGTSPSLPAAEAAALWGVVGERIGDDFDVDAAARRVLDSMLSRVDDPEMRTLAELTVSAAVNMVADDVRRHTLGRVAEVYPVDKSSAGPRSTVLRAGLENPVTGEPHPVKAGGMGWRVDLARFQRRGTPGSRLSFTTWNPATLKPVVETSPELTDGA